MLQPCLAELREKGFALSEPREPERRLVLRSGPQQEWSERPTEIERKKGESFL
jgi:hypothetical protein